MSLTPLSFDEFYDKKLSKAIFLGYIKCFSEQYTTTLEMKNL